MMLNERAYQRIAKLVAERLAQAERNKPTPRTTGNNVVRLRFACLSVINFRGRSDASHQNDAE